MEYIIFKAFSRKNNVHSYVYVTSDVLTRKDGAREDAWDILLVDKTGLDSMKFKPIFVEVKSSFEDAKKVLCEMMIKINLTLSLLNSRSGVDQILAQIPEEVDNPPKLAIESPEFVIFFPSNFYNRIYKRAIKQSVSVNKKNNPIILWSYENSGALSHCISIPYADEINILKCKNITKKHNSVILCKHNDDNLLKWVKSCSDQNLGAMGGIMPSGNGFTDMAVNLVAIFASGRVMNGQMGKIGKSDIISKIRNFFGIYRIKVSDDFINRIFEAMVKCKIISSNNDLLHTYSLNGKISRNSKQVDVLIEDIVKRLVKNNFGKMSETLEGSVHLLP
jgi:hypothetical protein